MLLVNFFIFNLFLLMKMKYEKKIIACTMLITLLLSDIGLKNHFLLPCLPVDV